MRASLFIIGLYLMVASIQGNGMVVWDDFKEQKGFIPWIAAIAILWAIWKYSPSEISELTHAAILVGLLAVVITHHTEIVTQPLPKSIPKFEGYEMEIANDIKTILVLFIGVGALALIVSHANGVVPELQTLGGIYNQSLNTVVNPQGSGGYHGGVYG